MTYMPTGPGQGGPHHPASQFPESQQPEAQRSEAQRPETPYAGGGGPDTESTENRDGDVPDNGLVRTLGFVAAGLGVLILLLGFAPFEKLNLADLGSGPPITDGSFYKLSPGAGIVLLLIAGLIATLGALPKQPKLAGVAAACAVGGFLDLVFSVIAVGTTNGLGVAWGAYVELVLGLVLTAAVVGAMLIEAGIISPSAGKPAQQSGFGGSPYGQGSGNQYNQSGVAPQSQGSAFQYGQSTGGSYGQGGAVPYGQSGGSQYGQQAGSSYGQPVPSQYGTAQGGQFGIPQAASEQSYGQAAPSAQPQQGSGYYAQQQPSYGQQQQQPSYPQPPQQPFGQQPPPEQPSWQQESAEGEPSRSSYSPPTQAFGSHAVEDETTVHPREAPHDPPAQH